LARPDFPAFWRVVSNVPSTLVAMHLAADGSRFLALVPEHAGVVAVTIVQTWRAALRGSR
jgi:hypothetical protein